MLIRLLPKQVSDHWDEISDHIKESLVPTVDVTPDLMNNILAALLSGKMVCWVSVFDESSRINSICVTQVLYDDASDTKSLLFYSIYSINNMSEEEWKSGFETLRVYGKKLGCKKVIAYTNLDYIIDIAKMLGGEAKYTYLSIPL